MPKTSQFPTPSAALVMGANVLLFQGGKADSNGTHAIEFLSAPIPPTSQQPHFSVPQITDQSGAGPVNKGVITSIAASVPPIALTLDGQSVQLIYATMGQGYGLYEQRFVWNGTGYDRTASSQIVSAHAPQEFPKVTFGAATLPGEQAYLLACTPAASKQIAFQYTDTSGTINTYSPWLNGPSDPNWRGDVTMTVVRNPVDPTPDEPYLIVLVYQCGQTLYGATLRLGAVPDSGAPEINFGSLQMQALSIDSDFLDTTPSSVSLHRGMDGAAYLLFADKQWRTLHIGTMGYAPGGPPQCASTTASAYYEIDRMPPVIYASGDFPDPSVSGDSAVVPVYRTILFDTNSSEITQIGSARRSATTQDGPADPPGMLIGYVEGGPPVPNEIVQSTDPTVQPVVATMTYGVETSKDTDTSYSFSVGLMVKMSEEDGIPWVGTVDVDMDLDTGYNGKWTQSTQQKLLQKFKQNTEIEAVTGSGNVVKPEGTAFVYIANSFTAWQYDFLDGNGQPNPLASTYIQLVPNEPEIIPFPYAIDPTGALYPIPGILSTYYMDADEVQQLEQQAAIKCSVSDAKTGAGSPGNFPETGWAASGGDVESEVALLTKDTAQNGFYADASEMVGGTVMGTKVQVGLKTKFDFDSGWGTEQTSQYGSDVNVSVDSSEVPGEFSRYTFKTMMLAPNASYTADLLARLAYADSHGWNQDLKNHIQPNSTPWKITYAVLSHNPAMTEE